MSGTPLHEILCKSPQTKGASPAFAGQVDPVHTGLSNYLPEEEAFDSLDLDLFGTFEESSSTLGSPKSTVLQEIVLSSDTIFDEAPNVELENFELDLELLGQYLATEDFDSDIFNLPQDLSFPQADTQGIQAPNEQDQQLSPAECDGTLVEFPADLSLPLEEIYGFHTLEQLDEYLATVTPDINFPVLDEADQALLQSLISSRDDIDFPTPQESFIHDEPLYNLRNGLPTFMSSPNSQSDPFGDFSLPPLDLDLDFQVPPVRSSTGTEAPIPRGILKLPSSSSNKTENTLQIGNKEYEAANPRQTEDERGKIFLDFRQTYQSLRAYKFAKSNEQIISQDERAVILANDPSFPNTNVEQRRDHRDLYMAIRDCSYAKHVKDVSSRLQQPIAYKKFTVGYGEEMEKHIQDLCWEMLENLIKEQMKYISDTKRSRKKVNPITFAMRKEKVIQAFLKEKDIPKRLLEESFISQVARDPEGHSSRVRNNRRVNDKKGVQIKAGARILQSNSNPLNLDEDGELEEELVIDKSRSPSRPKRTPSRRKTTSSPTNAGVSKSTRPRRHTRAGS
jgi:hypothetical protein